MSSGSRIKLYVAEETSLGVLPADPIWYTVPRITDGLTENVTTTASELSKDTRFRQAPIATQAEIIGDLSTELSVGTFDLFIAAVAMNDWDADSLLFGGGVRKSFTFIKEYSDVGIIRQYSGVMINTMSLNISNGEKIGANFGLMGTGYTPITTSPVTNPIDLMGDKKLVSALNVGEFLLNGQSTVGTACLQSLTLEINNNLEAVYCIGNKQLSAEKYIEKKVDITLTTQFMFSGQVAEYSDKIKTGDTTEISFEIEDADGNTYAWTFPKLTVQEAPHPDAGGEDLVMQDITFAHIDVSPTLTRLLSSSSTPNP